MLVSSFSCEKGFGLKDPSADAPAVFDDFWKTIDRNYALFPVKNINWDSVYTKLKPQVTPGMSNPDLFKKLSDAIETLRDGHVTLTSSGKTYTYDLFYTLYPLNFNLDNIKTTYLLNQYKQAGPIIYKIVNNVGYIYYASFFDNISDDDLNTVFTDMASTKGLIVDVRSNNGGNLSNAEKLFSRFISSKILIRYELKKKGPDHNDFYVKEAVSISPGGITYTKPVTVLTNRSCFSACNDFVMYMAGLPNVRTVGDQTGGGGAVPAEYLLTNGWKLRYSSSLTLSADGVPAENGIAADVPITITPIDETTKKDPIIEKAYQLLQ